MLPTDPGVGRVRRLCSMLNDAQSKAIRVEGWGRDSDRLGQTDVL